MAMTEISPSIDLKNVIASSFMMGSMRVLVTVPDLFDFTYLVIEV
jgi:hypothetical protein